MRIVPDFKPTAMVQFTNEREHGALSNVIVWEHDPHPAEIPSTTFTVCKSCGV
jgi:hypothetical protein